MEDGDDAEDDEPEPEDEVDLLVDVVLGEDAQPVGGLRAARRPHTREVAGHLRGEGSTHWIPYIGCLKCC